MRSHIGLLPQCLFIVRSRAKVKRLEESYVSRAAQRPHRVGSGRLAASKCSSLFNQGRTYAITIKTSSTMK